MNETSSSDQLADILFRQYPQMQNIDCKVWSVEEVEGQPVYKAKVCLFDQVLITSTGYSSKSEAEQAIRLQAKETMDEFVSIQLSNLPENIKQVITPVDGLMKTFDPNGPLPTSFPKIESVDGLGAGNDPVKIVRLNEEDLKSLKGELVATKDPISFLQQMASKSRIQDPQYHCFEQIGKHGCELCYNGATVTVPAVHNSKVNARRAAAKLLCEQLFSQYPDIKFSGPTVESVEVVEKRKTVQKPIEKAVADSESSQPQSTAVPQLNIWCQKAGVSMPEATFEQPSNGVFVCTMSAFGVCVKSAAHSKKAQAKEEAAKLFLLQASQIEGGTAKVHNTTIGLAKSVEKNGEKGKNLTKEKDASSTTIDIDMQSQPSIASPPLPINEPQSTSISQAQQQQQQPSSFPQMPPQGYPPYHMLPSMYGNPYMALPPMWPPYTMPHHLMYGQPPPQHHQPAFPGPIHNPNQQSPILPSGSILMMPNAPQPPTSQSAPLMMHPPFIPPQAPPPFYHHPMYTQPPPTPNNNFNPSNYARPGSDPNNNNQNGRNT